MKSFQIFSFVSLIFLASSPLFAKQEPCPCKDATIVYENGGGLISPNIIIHTGSVYIGKNAKVCGNATILHNAKILDYARVCENASIMHDTVISGNARVFGSADVHHSAKIQGNAWLFNQANIGQNSIVKNNVMIFGKGDVIGNSIIFGEAMIQGRVANLKINYNIFSGYEACLLSQNCPDGQYKVK